MDTPSQQNLNQLPIGTLLGDFKITGIVGEGGFGIVYLAYEAALDRTVAIKEYLPSSIAGRTGNQSVMVRSQLNSNAFTSGLKNFLREAQLLARFSHPAMVEVHRVWEQNSTAYMAMRFYDGKTLRELRQGVADFDERYVRRLVEPVFDALTLLHAQNVIHRDVSPDNILMRGNGAPVLLDLGAARLVIGGMTQALTTILKPGYAPIEQYVDDGTMRQGPWTDVYGLGAVIYYLLTGAAPAQAVARMITDPLRATLATNTKVAVAPYFLDALAKALAVRPDDRYQSVDELRDGLQWNEPLPVEPRTAFATTHARAEVAKLAAAAEATRSLAAKTVTEPLLPTAVLKPEKSAAPLPPNPQPERDRVFPNDSDATVVWQRPAAVAATTLTGSTAASAAPPPPVPAAIPAPPPPPPSIAPPIASSPMPDARAVAYGDSAGSGSKMWVYAALAALVAAGAGYLALTRSEKSPAPAPPVVVSNPATATPPLAAPPENVVTPPVAMTDKPKTAPISPAAAPPAQAPAKIAGDPAKAATDAKAKEAARLEQEELALARSKRDIEDKAKARAEALEKSAKAKSDADERARVRAKIDADERAAATARADIEEKARKARAEEEERLVAAKVRAEAERAAKSAWPTPGGLVVTPPRRTVEELSALGKAAFGRGELAAARSAWNELVNHPEAQARSKAITYNNLAVSYCQAGDEATCERMYTAMFRADRNYGADVNERDLPQFKRAYDRAARAARAQY